MPKPFPHLLLIFLITLILSSMAMAQDSESLKKFLQEYDGNHSDSATRYLKSWVDLNGDGKKEIIAYLIQGGWCGSGGCTALILEPQATSYRVITKLTVTKLPICVLATTSHGWHDLTVFVQGGGILQGHDAELRFNGRKYPSNPTVPPAKPLRRKVESKIIISDDDYEIAEPLYP